MRAQFLLLLLLGGCEVDGGGDRGGRNDRGDSCQNEGDCPAARPWCCDADDDADTPRKECFQFKLDLGGDLVCVNDQCVTHSDCGRGEACCNFEDVLGVPYNECWADGETYYTQSGYYGLVCER